MKMVHRVAAIGMVAAACAVAWGQDDPFSGRVVVRAKPETLQELRAAELLAEDVWSCAWGIGRIDVMLPRERLPLLAEAGIEFDVMVEDVSALIAAERAQIEAARRQRDAAWFNTFRDLTGINDRLDMYLATYPRHTVAVTVGQSLEGRPIRGVRISAPDTPENPRDQRAVFVINATQHAREWAAPMAAMWQAETLLEGFMAGDADIMRMMEGIDFVIIPVVNVDGYAWTWSSPNNRLWRKNRRGDGTTVWGVDLNRNWSFQWGGGGSSGNRNSETYRGPAAFSEPESSALRDFLTAETRLRAHLDIHTYGQLLLSPWGYTQELPPDVDLFRALDFAARDVIFRETRSFYDVGPAITTLYQTSGSLPDWVYGELGFPSWLIELRDQGLTGFVLPAAQIIPTAQENAAAVETLASWILMPVSVTVADVMPRYAPADQPVEIVATVRDGTRTSNGQPPVLEYGPTTWQAEPSGAIVMSALPQAPGAPPSFAASIPIGPCGEPIQYRVSVIDDLGRKVYWPPEVVKESRYYEMLEYYPLGYVFFDDFETDRGWVLHAPGSTATGGAWERGDPQQTEAQPGGGSTNNGRGALVTGRARGSSVEANDVDDGITIAMSPRFDLRRPPGTTAHVAVSWDRYYNNGPSPGEEFLLTQFSADDGVTWHTRMIDGGWITEWVRITDLRVNGSGTPLTDGFRLRFLAQDLNEPSLVEAVIDNFRLSVIFCPRSADFDGSGGVDVDDIAAFFNAWQRGLPSADFDESGGVDGDDIAEFIAAWQLG